MQFKFLKDRNDDEGIGGEMGVHIHVVYVESKSWVIWCCVRYVGFMDDDSQYGKGFAYRSCRTVAKGNVECMCD